MSCLTPYLTSPKFHATSHRHVNQRTRLTQEQSWVASALVESFVKSLGSFGTICPGGWHTYIDHLWRNPILRVFFGKIEAFLAI
jgi:hypothetical protein